jgi:hypothetical protein
VDRNKIKKINYKLISMSKFPDSCCSCKYFNKDGTEGQYGHICRKYYERLDILNEISYECVEFNGICNKFKRK